jgi:hypothetical protein
VRGEREVKVALPFQGGRYAKSGGCSHVGKHAQAGEVTIVIQANPISILHSCFVCKPIYKALSIFLASH